MTREQFLFMKLAEEATEVAQIALKTVQFGGTEKHPDLKDNNYQRVCAELNDLLTIVEMLRAETEFYFKFDFDHEKIKTNKVNKFYKYSQDLGMLPK